MPPADGPNQRSVAALLATLSDACGSHPENLALVKAKSREELYSDIAGFLQRRYDRGVFFQLDKADLQDFLLLALFTQRLLGLWVSLSFEGRGALASPEPGLLDAISEGQYSDYNCGTPPGIAADFDLVGSFCAFKKTRVRISAPGRQWSLGGLFFEERAEQFGFLRGAPAVERWLEHHLLAKTAPQPGPESPRQAEQPRPQPPSKGSFAHAESFFQSE